MKEYLEQIMHRDIDERPLENTGDLPPVCRNAFKLDVLKLGQQEFLLATPVEDMNLTELRKMRLRLERYTDYICAFYLKNVNWYAAPKMVEEGIPFVWENHQVYLPFMGILLKENARRMPKNCAVISFLTQKMLLKALYEDWQDVSAIRAAELLDVSRMSVTRCFDEVEALGLPFIRMQGRSRRFHALSDKKEMWSTMLPVLRDPVIRTFRLEQKPNADMVLAGISALAEYSMLEADDCPSYAVGKDRLGECGIREIREVPANEVPACVVCEVGYVLPFGSHGAVDPLSLTLMLNGEDLEDPRVEICVNEMLEEWVW